MNGVKVMHHVLDCYHDQLLARQSECLKLSVQGLSIKQIADRMHIEPCSVKALLGKMLARFGVQTRMELLAKIIEEAMSIERCGERAAQKAREQALAPGLKP